MKPLTQLIPKHDPDNGQIGDCFRACVCSILEMDPVKHRVPNFAAYEEKWWTRFIDWADSYGYGVFWGSQAPKHIDFYIVSGTSPRGHLHAVIYSQGKLVHDPHPEGGGVKDIVDYIWMEEANHE